MHCEENEWFLLTRDFIGIFQGLAQEASISYISPPQTKNPDESITFNCTVIKPKDINVSWLKDSQMLTLGSVAVFYNPRIRITVDDASSTYSLHVSLLFDTLIISSSFMQPNKCPNLDPKPHGSRYGQIQMPD